MRLFPQLKNLHARLLEHIELGTPAALATIIQASGSTPQIPGFSAIFTPQGLIHGTLGGGILEKDAERRAKEALSAERAVVYSFDLEADLTSPEGAICGGAVRILIDAEPARHLPAFQALVTSLERRSSGALVSSIILSGESQVELTRRWVSGPDEDLSDGEISPRFRERIEACINRKQAELFPASAGDPSAGGPEELLFCEPFVPIPRLLIAGAGHIGAAVAHLGNRLEFEVTVIDDRPEFANAENCPDADHILTAGIGQALGELEIGPDTYVVVVTRGHRHDGEALRACIVSPAAYLGMIGSRHKIALMRQQFLEEGWATAEQWDRVHTPIGLEIGSQTVEEIAISIAAQLVSVRSRTHGGSARP